jgi:hypothetical protein
VQKTKQGDLLESIAHPESCREPVGLFPGEGNDQRVHSLVRSKQMLFTFLQQRYVCRWGTAPRDVKLVYLIFAQISDMVIETR